jgi:hypothetical protein
MAFVFGGDSDELIDEAIEDIKGEIARTIHPSSSCERLHDTISSAGHDSVTVATCGSIRRDASSENLASEAAWAPKAKSDYSQLRAYGNSDADGTTLHISTKDMTTSPDAGAALASPIQKELSDSHVTNIGTNDAPALISRFSLPKQFVGRLAPTFEAAAPPRVSSSMKRGPGKKMKERKYSNSGRTDIRALPDYDGDPIDEF